MRVHTRVVRAFVAFVCAFAWLAGCTRADAVQVPPEVQATRAEGPLVDFGGEVMPTATIRFLWWGAWPTEMRTELQDKLTRYCGGLTASPYFNVVDEYLRGAQHSYACDPVHKTVNQVPPGTSPSTASIAAAIKNTYGLAGVTTHGPSVYIVLGYNYSTWPDSCGLHNSFKWKIAGWPEVTQSLFYMPNNGLNPNAGCMPYGNNTPAAVFVAETLTITHELNHLWTSRWPCSPNLAYCDEPVNGQGFAPGWAKANDPVWEGPDICQWEYQRRTLPSDPPIVASIPSMYSNQLDDCWWGGLEASEFDVP